MAREHDLRGIARINSRSLRPSLDLGHEHCRSLSLRAALTVDNPRRSFAGSARALAGVPGELRVHVALHYVRQRKTSLGDK